MKAITLWQPWASAIAFGIKKIETRAWSTRHRGYLLIHAAQKTPRIWQEIGQQLCEKYFPKGTDLQSLPYGRIVAKVNLVDVIQITEKTASIDPLEWEWGRFEKGRFAWYLQNLDCPERGRKISGKQGIWDAGEFLQLG